MKTRSRDFRVPAGEQVDLEKWPTRVQPIYNSKRNYHKLLDEQVGELKSLQRLHYASNGYAVLVIFQGMDAAGKDGAIRQVMSGVNPQGCPNGETLESLGVRADRIIGRIRSPGKVPCFFGGYAAVVPETVC